MDWMAQEIKRLNAIINAYSVFEGDVETAAHKVNNDRLNDAFETLNEELRKHKKPAVNHRTVKALDRWLAYEKQESAEVTLPRSEAKSAYNYLISKGIGDDQLVTQGAPDELTIGWGNRK